MEQTPIFLNSWTPIVSRISVQARRARPIAWKKQKGQGTSALDIDAVESWAGSWGVGIVEAGGPGQADNIALQERKSERNRQIGRPLQRIGARGYASPFHRYTRPGGA